ncbi:MAG: helix-turn-helix domain-containing protein [Planctomycetes bacterium]|nr:helix-turn-helix domain-containing protein [Planctomycetota bacterium]
MLRELKLYSLKELSEILGITTFTLRTYIRQGKLKARKMGTKWLVTEEALKDYFSDTKKEEKENRVVLQGITRGSKVTEKDIREAKEIWK